MLYQVADFYQLRSLRSTDSQQLGQYFEQLGEETKARFGPHPLTAAYASELCKATDAACHRLVLCIENRICGYVILDLRPYPEDYQRYQKYGIELCAGLDAMLAPSIADDLQGKGLASQMMPCLLDFARQHQVRHLVLMGGTQQGNDKAIRLYKRAGFIEVGQFVTQLLNYDMYLPLIPASNCKKSEDNSD
jgi:GNAT superfamily N-acetyltransferase